MMVECIRHSLRRAPHSAMAECARMVDYTETNEALDQSGINRIADSRRTAERSLYKDITIQELPVIKPLRRGALGAV